MGKKEQAEEALESLKDIFPDCWIFKTGTFFWEMEDGLRMKSNFNDAYLIRADEINVFTILGAFMGQFEEATRRNNHWIGELGKLYEVLSKTVY